MIQGAHIGVGIRGREGSAAVQASDMAISQFRFLGNLVFCHGRKAYRRLSTFLCYFIYKSVVLGWSYIIYAHSIGFLGMLSYPEWLDILYNPLTSAAAVVVLALDVDYEDEEALRRPWLYKPGHDREYLNGCVFAKWMWFASLHGILAWGVPVYVLASREDVRDQTKKFWEASFTAFTVIFVTIHLKFLIVAEKPMQCLGIVVMVLEVLAYIPIAAFLGSPYAHSLSPELSDPTSVPWKAVTSRVPWLCIVLVPLAAVLIDLLEALVRYRRRKDAWDNGGETTDSSADEEDDSMF